MTKMTSVLLRLEPGLLSAIDKVRGDVPRSVFIRKRLLASISDPVVPDCAEEGAFVHADTGEEYDSGLRVQVGPAASKPGSRLKPDKGAKR